MRNVKVLMATLALCGAATAQADVPSAIVFDGFCDGITDIAVHKGIVSGTWANMDCHGATSPTVGQRARVARVGAGFTGHYEHPSFIWMVVRINDDGTWTYHSPSGNVFAEGTWSDATAARVAPGQRPSTQP